MLRMIEGTEAESAAGMALDGFSIVTRILLDEADEETVRTQVNRAEADLIRLLRLLCIDIGRSPGF